MEHKNLKLYDTIVLHGIIGYSKTYDDADTIIGINNEIVVKCFDGTTVKQVLSGFPFSKEMEQKCGWLNSYASIQMFTGKTPIDMDHFDETMIVSMEGYVDSYYYHDYSSYTGYLGTAEGFKAGGHDLIQILSSHMGEYIHMEIKLYKEDNHEKSK